MRKLAAFALFFLLLCGCAEKPSTIPPAPTSPLAGHSGSFEATATMRMPGLAACATVSQSPESCLVVFTAPESLAGMECLLDQDSADVDYKGLQFTFDPQALPDGAIAGILSDAVRSAVKAEGVSCTPTADGGTELAGTLNADAFTLLLDAQGTPLKLLLPGRDMEIEFGNFRFLD